MHSWTFSLCLNFPYECAYKTLNPWLGSNILLPFGFPHVKMIILVLDLIQMFTCHWFAHMPWMLYWINCAIIYYAKYLNERFHANFKSIKHDSINNTKNFGSVHPNFKAESCFRAPWKGVHYMFKCTVIDACSKFRTLCYLWNHD